MERPRAKKILFAVLTLFWYTPGFAGPAPLTLQEAMDLALKYNPGVAANLAQREAARAGERTAAAYPNPVVEAGAGPSFTRDNRDAWKSNWGVSVLQPIEYPALRDYRIRGAVAGTGAAQANIQIYNLNLLADVKGAFYGVIRSRGEMQIAEEDLNLLEQILQRVKVRVETGEAPRYELIKSDAELLNARKALESAGLRVNQAKANLARLIGPSMGEDFEVAGHLDAPREIPPLSDLRQEVTARNPAVLQIQAEQVRARARLGLERELAIPQLAVQAGVDQDPDVQSWRMGLSVVVPVWNRREGPIAEARAGISQVDAQLEQVKLILLRDLDAAYNQFLIHLSQVNAYETGLLSQAQAALNVAAAAYRLGERGILDYLDAQRVYRQLRLDYLNAHYELQRAFFEIQRLQAADLKERTP